MLGHHHHHQHPPQHNEVPKAPLAVTIGIPREGLNHFDDMTELAKHPGPYRIHEIVVQYNKHHILGTEFKYIAANGHHYTGHNITKFKPFKEVFGHVHEETFKIPEDDELLEIHGRVGLRINKLGFKTYKGKHKEIGIDDGNEFVYRFDGYSFGSVSGGFGEHLDYLSILTHPLPENRKHVVIVITH